ncbi:MAG: DNA polymerase III subunit alpha [bacterium]
MKFTHLHTHSHYSLLDGLAKIDDLVAKAKEYKMDSLALTDHGVMYGVIEFYQKCKKEGIKPIIGVEFYVAPNGRLNKRAKIDEEKYHLVLLAKNESGYKNLIQLTTISHLEGFYYKPRVDLELLEKFRDGLIAMTGCLGGEIPTLLKNGNYIKAKETAERYRALYGEDNFYLEMQYHKDSPDQIEANKGLMELGKEMGIALVATNDIHYVDYQDRFAHDILLCLQTKKRLEDKNRMSMLEFDVSFRSPEAMVRDFSDFSEAIANTQKIADECNLEIELGVTKLPQYQLQEGVTEEAFLNKLCVQGLKERYGIGEDELEIRNSEISDDKNLESGKWPASCLRPACAGGRQEAGRKSDGFIKNVVERMEYELKVISKMGFPSYFLIVQDFVNWAKNNGVVVGPGRGSAAGSLVSYLINVTDVDPIKYDLLFERFLNPERISMPDIDIDFADTKRENVIRYVEEKYGKDHVAQIITFGTMAARAAVRDVGRVLGMPLAFCDKIAKMIPMFCSLDKAIDAVPDVKEIYATNSDAKKLIDTARKLEGVARHSSRHACGIIITKDPLTCHVPLQYASADDKTIVSQYSLHPVDDLGLLKIDFLGLKNLTIIERAVKIIKRIYGIAIDINNLPIDDKKTYRLFQEGSTTGIFQFESSGMRRYLKELKPTDIEDLIAMVSLYRPGPMELIPEYVSVKHGRKKPSYLHPFLKPILDKTYGIAIYQEQLLQIARDLACFSLGEADVLRRAIGKKIVKLLAEQKKKFIGGCVKNGIQKDIAEKVFAFMEPFAGYGFNRSHAACYAIIAYQTAYLKANYPAEFMAALMTSDYGNSDKIALEIEEAKRMGIEILPPDINESFKTFTVIRAENGAVKIRFGLSAVKNLGENIIESIKDEREKNGKFLDLDDFIKRVNCKDFNKKSLESLIKSGSLDSFGERGLLTANVDNMLLYSKNEQKMKDSGQVNLFGENHSFKIKLEATSSASKMDKLIWEKEFLGLYISDHPFRDFSNLLREKIIKIENLCRAEDNKTIRIGGVVSEVKKIVTKKNESMAFVKVEDETGSAEVIVFPSIFNDYREKFLTGIMVVITGKVSSKDGAKKIICDEVFEINENNYKKLKEELVAISFHFDEAEKEVEEFSGDSKIKITVKNKDQIILLKNIFTSYAGINEIYLEVGGKLVKTTHSIDFCNEAKLRLEEIVGKGNVGRF